MKTKRKTFDCVAMKRAGAFRVYRRLKGMTLEEKVAFWQKRSESFQRERTGVRQRPVRSRRTSQSIIVFRLRKR